MVTVANLSKCNKHFNRIDRIFVFVIMAGEMVTR